MRKVFLAIAIALISRSLSAQLPTDVRQFVLASICAEYRVTEYPDWGAASIGFTSGMEMVLGHILAGVGFDNGIRNTTMTNFNAFLYLKGGYVFYKNNFLITPYFKAGWFADKRPSFEYGNITRYNQILIGTGVEGVWTISEYIWITAGLQVFATDLSAKGYTTTFGMKMPLYEIPKKKRS